MRALLLTAALTGLRASELRGLRWTDVDLKAGEIHVRQRADRYCVIGAPKSASSRRAIPLAPELLTALKTWKLACPIGEVGLVFPTAKGRVEHHVNMLRSLAPAMVAAGVVDKHGKPKYALHAFRHFFASWCIDPKERGGRELPAKVVQQLLGHSSVVMTLDRYGHRSRAAMTAPNLRRRRGRSAVLGEYHVDAILITTSGRKSLKTVSRTICPG